MRTTFTLDDELAAEAHRYGVALSAAAREGVAAAVRRAKEARDRAAYLEHPETDDGWGELEAWTSDGDTSK
jgi:post-segregation antitoxin (ccd killing protein)